MFLVPPATNHNKAEAYCLLMLNELTLVETFMVQGGTLKNADQNYYYRPPVLNIVKTIFQFHYKYCSCLRRPNRYKFSHKMPETIDIFLINFQRGWRMDLCTVLRFGKCRLLQTNYYKRRALKTCIKRRIACLTL